MKYFKKGKKICTAIMPIHANVMHCKQIIGTKCERTAKSMATLLKFPLSYSMKLVKLYSIK
jgi:hypothetical protein